MHHIEVYFSLQSEFGVSPDSSNNFISILDRAYKERLSKATNQINSACMPNGLVATFPNNNLQLMVQAGAKGKVCNFEFYK